MCWGEKEGQPLLQRLGSLLYYLAFEFTCGYGLYYGRPLGILAMTVPTLALVYRSLFGVVAVPPSGGSGNPIESGRTKGKRSRSGSRGTT